VPQTAATFAVKTAKSHREDLFDGWSVHFERRLKVLAMALPRRRDASAR
jgi:hypothetical protein